MHDWRIGQDSTPWDVVYKVSPGSIQVSTDLILGHFVHPGHLPVDGNLYFGLAL